MTFQEIFLLGLGSFVASLLWTLVVENLAHRFRIFDQPGERKIHSHPVPRLGGSAFFLVPLLFYLFGYFDLPSGFILGAICVYFGGFYDDLRPANSALVKLMTQIPAAVILSATLEFPYLDLSFAGVMALRFVIASYVLFMINAANLMDNMNGLTGGIAVIWLAGLYLLGEMADPPVSSGIPLIVIFGCSILGFFVRNFPWGKIYMGDQGSQLVGFSLAGLSLMVLPSIFDEAGAAGVIAGTSVLLLLLSFVFISDVLTVSVIRIREQRPLWKGDQCHLSHQLVRKGFSQAAAALALNGAQFVFVILSAVLCFYWERVLSF